MTQLHDLQSDLQSDLQPDEPAVTTLWAIVLAFLGRAHQDELLSILTLLERKAISIISTHELPISRAGFELWLDEEYTAHLRQDVKQQEPIFYRHLCATLVDWLIMQNENGDCRRQEQLEFLLNQHATYLMQESPGEFQVLIERIAPLAFQHAALHHLRRYFTAVLNARQDRYEAAITQLSELLHDPALDVELHGRALNSQAIYLQLTGRLEQAVEGYDASLELWRRLGNRTRAGMALLNLGILHYQLQEYTPSEEHLLAAADCFLATENEYQLASVQNQLGLLYRDQGLLDEAATCFDAVATQRRAISDWDSLGRALNNRGEVRLFQGRWDEAEVDFVEALGKMQSRTFAVDSYLNLGLTRQVRADLSGAHQMFQRALAIAEEIGRRDILAEIHYRLGDAYRRLGKDEEALRQLEAAATVVERGQGEIRSEQLRIGLLGRWQQIYEAVVLQCVQMGKIELAFLWAERSRARAFAEALTQRHQDELLQQVNGQLATLSQLSASLPAHSLLLCYFTTGVIEHEMPFLRALPSDHALRPHLLLSAQTLCFALSARDVRLHNCQLDPNAIATHSPRSDDRSRFFESAVRTRLSRILLPEPIAHYQRIYLILHGPLHQVPCATLLDDNQQSWLQPNGPALTYAPSATILWRQWQRTPSTRTTPQLTCLAVGCDLDGAHQLRHTEAEAQSVASLFAGKAVVGGEPKAQSLLSLAQQVDILHIACHGWFDPDQPLASYLQTGHHEVLSAQEILATWRIEVKLVTLSACQSGVQRLLRSDEPMGLVRAFLYAGAQAVLATQWPVADLPTFLLMRQLYRQLGENSIQSSTRSIATALRDAQCWLRSVTLGELRADSSFFSSSSDNLLNSLLSAQPSDQRPFADPIYWAGFVLFAA